MGQWTLHGLRERLSDSLYVLTQRADQVLQTWRIEKSSVLSYVVWPHLDDSVRCDVLQLLLRGGGLRGRNSTGLPLLRRLCFAGFLSRTSVPEDAHNKEVDGKHDD